MIHNMTISQSHNPVDFRMGRKTKSKASAVLRANLRPLEQDTFVSDPVRPGAQEDSMEEKEAFEEVMEASNLDSGFISNEDLSLLKGIGGDQYDPLDVVEVVFNREAMDQDESDQKEIHLPEMGKNSEAPHETKQHQDQMDSSETTEKQDDHPQEDIEDDEKMKHVSQEGENQQDQEVHQLIEKLRLLSIESSEGKRETEKLKRELDSKDADIKVLNKRIQDQEDLAKKVEELQTKFGECKLSKQALSKEAKANKLQVEKVLSENKDLQEKYKAIEAKCEDLAKVNVNLEKDVIKAAEQIKMTRAEEESKLDFFKQQSKKEVEELTKDFLSRETSQGEQNKEEVMETLSSKLQRAEEIIEEMKISYDKSTKFMQSEKQILMGQLQMAKLDVENQQRSYNEAQNQLSKFQVLLNKEIEAKGTLTALHQQTMAKEERAWMMVTEKEHQITELRRELNQSATANKRKSSQNRLDESKRAKELEEVLRQDLSIPPPQIPFAGRSLPTGRQEEEVSMEEAPSPLMNQLPVQQGIFNIENSPRAAHDDREVPPVAGPVPPVAGPVPQVAGPVPPVAGPRLREPAGGRQDGPAARPEWPIQDVPLHPKFENRAAVAQVVTTPIHALLMEPRQLEESYGYIKDLGQQVNHNCRLVEQMVPQIWSSQLSWDQYGNDRDLLVKVVRWLSIPRKPLDLTNELTRLATSGTFQSDEVNMEICKTGARWVFPDMMTGSKILEKIFDPTARHFRRWAIRFLMVILTPAYHVHFTRLAATGYQMEQGCVFFFGPRAGGSFVKATLHLVVTLATAMANASYKPDCLGLPATNPEGTLPVGADGAPTKEQLRLLQNQTGFRENIIEFVDNLEQREFMYNDIGAHIDKREKPALKKLFHAEVHPKSMQLRSFFNNIGIRQAGHQNQNQRSSRGRWRQY